MQSRYCNSETNGVEMTVNHGSGGPTLRANGHQVPVEDSSVQEIGQDQAAVVGHIDPQQTRNWPVFECSSSVHRGLLGPKQLVLCSGNQVVRSNRVQKVQICEVALNSKDCAQHLNRSSGPTHTLTFQRITITLGPSKCSLLCRTVSFCVLCPPRCQSRCVDLTMLIASGACGAITEIR